MLYRYGYVLFNDGESVEFEGNFAVNVEGNALIVKEMDQYSNFGVPVAINGYSLNCVKRYCFTNVRE